MIPSWLRTLACLVCAYLVAVFIGSFLPELGEMEVYIVAVVIVCSLCFATNNFPFLLALAIWYPFVAPVPFFKMLPSVSLVILWFLFLAFFRSCVQKSIRASPSCNLFIALTFLWVPVRFLLNPVHKFGGGVVGGSGSTGANAYFLYLFAGLFVVIIGTIIDDREKALGTMRWLLRFAVIFGIGLSICAFIPVTQYFLIAHGIFDAGELAPGVFRIVNLGGYGVFLVGAAFCPALFRLNTFEAIVLFALGCGMIALGGDRGSVLQFIIMLPVILVLRRKFITLFAAVAVGVIGTTVLIGHLDSLPAAEIPGYARVLGLVDSKIEKATGGDASARWRYDLWTRGIERIEESPLMGKGFGNLPASLDSNQLAQGTDSGDYDMVLSIGLAHNAWINAAYGFGIPFALALTVILIQRFIAHVLLSIKTFKFDPELSDFHTYLAAFFASITVGLYTAFDFSIYMLWLYIGMGLVVERTTRVTQLGSRPNLTPLQHSLGEPALKPS
jgi:hypothetical protein